jgi:hypothetical protein
MEETLVIQRSCSHRRLYSPTPHRINQPMKQQKLIAGLPLASWLGFIAAAIAGVALVVQYSRGRGIDWYELILAVFTFAFGVAIARRERALASRRQ